MRCEIVRDAEALSALYPSWRALWLVSSHRPVTLFPAWVDAYFRAEGGAGTPTASFEGELMVMVVRDGAELAGVVPLYLAPPRGGALRTRELRLLGDGMVGARQVVLAAPGLESRVRDAVCERLVDDASWDLLDLTLATGHAADTDAEALGWRFAELGRHVERDLARGAPILELSAPWARFVDGRRLPSWLAVPPAEGVLVEAAQEDLPGALAAIGRLVEGAGSSARAMARFLERALPPLVEAGLARVSLLDAPERGAIAAEVVVRDGERRIEVLRASAPTAEGVRLCEQLTFAAVHRAVDEGARRFELADESVLSEGRADGERLRVFRNAPAGMLQRGYASLRRRAASVADLARARVPQDTLDRLRDATPEAVSRAVSRVAALARLHLYRGELFVRGGEPVSALALRLMSLADFEALPDRARFLERLDLNEAQCREKWRRGDLVVTASHDGDPVGIVWCARGRVMVPDIGREVRPLAGECYIHDVYVAPDARGRNVAPAMLEFLARELRRRDVYRAWALIERANTASTRAFEKAAYASVADVIYARMGGAAKLLVRPPDPEAKAFLGLT